MSAEHTRKNDNKSYRYGSKTTTEIALDAVLVLGRPVTEAEVRDYIIERIPDFAVKNVRPDLSALCVNSHSRGNFTHNKQPRRTDEAPHPYDQLVRIGEGRGALYTTYDPAIHGIWALEDVGDKVLRPRQVEAPDAIELAAARSNAAPADAASDEDSRRRIMTALVQREGQPRFRRALLDEYAGACVISGCSVVELLEAAHIKPYLGPQTNDVTNGLLLRADLHKLFDLHMFRIDPLTHTVHLCDALKASEYACYEGARLREPKSKENAPAESSLRHHEDRCAWRLVETAVGPEIPERL